MALDLASASPEVQAFCDDCVADCRQQLQANPPMSAGPGQPMAAGFGAGFNLSQLPDLVLISLDLAVQFAGAPLETLVVSQKAAIRQFISQKVVDYVRQLANDVSDHPVMGAMRGQAPQAGHAATG
jgi:hypothetical protein